MLLFLLLLFIYFYLFKGQSSTRNSKEINYEDILASFDDELIAEDRAARLALEIEKRRKGKGVIIDNESYCWDGDEQLEYCYHGNEHVRKLQWPGENPRGLPRSICMGCHEILRGDYTSCSRGIWHARCFRCTACKNQINGSVIWRRGQQYCKSCASTPHVPKSHDSTGPTCDVCSKSLPSVHKTHKCWGQRYCTSHENDRTLRCCSCQSLEPRARDKKYISLGDARKLCLKCFDSAIMSTEECKPLLKDVESFFEGLNMKVNVDFPVLLVERSALNAAVSEEKAHILHKLPEVRGICTFQIRSIRHIRNAPLRIGNRFEAPQTEPYNFVPREGKVTSISVLFGYPRMLCGEILAHEMMHAYLRQKGYPHTLPEELEEGIAQVMAYRWLEAESVAGNGGYHQSSKGKRSMFDKKLGDFIKQSLMDSHDPVYGEGFRVALRAVDRYGLRPTLDHIKKYGRLP